MTYDDGYFREVQPGDIDDLVNRLREGDRKELIRWTGNTPRYEIERSVALSDCCWAGCYKDGSLVCLLGGRRDNILEETGIIWELSTESANEHRLAFLHQSKAGFDRIARALPDVEQFYNYVDLDYKGAVRWIEWLGGGMSIERPLQGLGGRFGKFIIMNPHYNGGETPCA